MSTVFSVLAVLLAAFVVLSLTLNVVVRLRAKAMQGKPLPEVPGLVGKKLARAKRALVYFMSPGCAACRPITPKVQALSKQNANVFVVDVSTQFEVARALKVMATPSTLEVENGRIVAVHVGSLPRDVMTRFAA